MLDMLHCAVPICPNHDSERLPLSVPGRYLEMESAAEQVVRRASSLHEVVILCTMASRAQMVVSRVTLLQTRIIFPSNWKRRLITEIRIGIRNKLSKAL